MWRLPSAVATTKKSALAASGTSTFLPSRTMPSPSALASIVKAPMVAGEPASQSAGTPRSSPPANGRRKRSRWSSEPQRLRAMLTIVLEKSGEGASA